MRLGVTLDSGQEGDGAQAAEAAGIPFVHVAAEAGTESAVAAIVAAATDRVRIVVGLHVGDEHPVTLAEEVAVLDNVSNGRVAVIAELGQIAAEAAVEDVALLRASWSGRRISHRGRRWQVPAGIAGHAAPPALVVTPSPAQLDVPLWVSGVAAPEVSRALSLPLVVDAVAAVDDRGPVAPGRHTLVGDLDADRAAVVEWAAAGATHLLCALGGRASLEEMTHWLAPEVAMVGFPRIVADSRPPAAWPGET